MTLYGEQYMVPFPLKDYLVMNYGKDFMIPNPRDTKSRNRKSGYKLGTGLLQRNHSTAHLNATHTLNGYYEYLNSDAYANIVLKAAAGIIPGKGSILDVGCATGGIARFVGKRRYLGIDGSETALKRARGRFTGVSNVSFEKVRIENYQWMGKPATWDTIVFAGILKTVIAQPYWIDYIKSYAQAFSAKHVLICDLQKVDFQVFRSAFKMVKEQNVSAGKLKTGYNSREFNRHMELYEL